MLDSSTTVGRPTSCSLARNWDLLIDLQVPLAYLPVHGRPVSIPLETAGRMLRRRGWEGLQMLPVLSRMVVGLLPALELVAAPLRRGKKHRRAPSVAGSPERQMLSPTLRNAAGTLNQKIGCVPGMARSETGSSNREMGGQGLRPRPDGPVTRQGLSRKICNLATDRSTPCHLNLMLGARARTPRAPEPSC